MGARFDIWLARPSTLRFLRHLIEPETPCMRPRTVALRNEAPIRARRYGTAAAAIAHSASGDVDWTISYVPAGIEREHVHTQIRNAAKELGLSLPQSLDTSYYESLDESSVGHFEILRTETNVQAASLQGKLLIDNPENATNLHGWCQVLRFRERVDGFDGVFDVWRGMHQRNVDLPISGKEADFLWTTFAHAVVVPEPSDSQALLLKYLYRHAVHLRKQTGHHYAGLHQLIVGRLLRIVPGPRNPHESRVLRWHAKLRDDGFCGPHIVRDLTMDALLSVQPESAFNRIKTLYDKTTERDLYNHCMPLVLQYGGERKALSWHRMFLRHGDKPSKAYAADPSIHFLHSWVEGQHVRTSTGTGTAHTHVARNALRASDAQAQAPLLSRASMNSLVGEVHGIKAKSISDNFCARMLATQAFSFDFILRGLAFLGAEELGSLSLRELAIRAQTLEEFRERISRVKQSGIRILDSMYIRLLQRLATDGKSELFQALLDSDQHPESYDDRRVQESLLNDFLVAEDWPQVHLTLIGLSLADFTMISTAWNRLLQHYAKARRYHEAMQIVENLHSTDTRMHLRSINFIRRYLLPFRSRSKRPHMARGTLPHGVDSLDLIVNIHLRAAERGAPIEPAVWRELLKRYGMAHRMDRLERLAISIAQMYADARTEKQSLAVERRVWHRKRSGLSAVFTTNMISAIVVWGWRSASVHDLLRPLSPEETQQLYSTSYWKSMRLDCEPWARGLLLLNQLKQLGVPVSDAEVADALRSRIWMLFGPGVSRLPINLEAIRRNRHNLRHYIKHANRAWDRPLFDFSADVLEGNYAQLAVAVLGKIRLANKNEGQYIDVAAWATAKASNAYHDAPPVRRARHYNWKYSPFRLSDGLSPAERRIRLRRRRAARPASLEAPSPAPEPALSPPQHQQTAAHPSSSHPQPSQLYTPEPS